MFHTSPKLTSGPPRITSPGRAFSVQVDALPGSAVTSRLPGSNLPHAGFGPMSQANASELIVDIFELVMPWASADAMVQKSKQTPDCLGKISRKHRPISTRRTPSSLD